MKRKAIWSLLTLVVLLGAFLTYTQSASSNSSNQHIAVQRAVLETSNLIPAAATMFDVDRTDDTAAPTACTASDNDCSLRGAIIAANANLSPDPVFIILQPGTTYSLTLTNATQENAAATGDLDITTPLHTVTIVGGGSSGLDATIIDAAGLNMGTFRDRAFHVTGSGVIITFEDLVIQNGAAADDGTSGVSANPASQNTTRFGGGILNNGGSVTLTNVIVQSCQALGKGDSVINDHTTLDAKGGGLASLTATGNVVIMGSTLSGNVAQGGNGGNFNNGAGSNAKGGSIYFEGGTLNIDGSRIDNSAANGGNGGNGPGNQQNGGFGGFAQGGGAYVGGGTVTINNSTFESCSAIGGNSGLGQNGTEPAGEGGGGGMYSAGNVTVTNSTFNSNSATGGNSGDSFGPDCFGAHESLDAGAARGGAILADGGSLVVDTATFASNSAHGGNGGNGGKNNGGTCAQSQHGPGGLAYGGALTNNNAATLNIKHTTISLNSAQAGNSGVNTPGVSLPAQNAAEGTGGGIRVGPGSVTLENTIIAGNTAANGVGANPGAFTAGPNVDGSVTSNGHNLLGVATEATGFSGTGDQTGANPLLAALADNGGPTQTMKPMPLSSAIDAGVAAGASFDQRGKPRTVDDPGVVNAATSDGTDVGAVEVQPDCILTCPTDISVSNDPDQCGAIVDYNTPSGSGCGRVTCDHEPGTFFGVGDTTVICTSPVGPTCSFKVTVNDAQDPTISAPGDAGYQCVSQVPAASPSQATASDNCGTPTVTVAESSNGGAGSIASPLIITRTYTTTDGAGHTASASQTITVIDNIPPTITLNGSVITLWPPNHQYVTVQVSSLVASASDNCDASVGLSGVHISKVTSDEAENGNGDGNTLNDIVIAGDCKSVQLRSERGGGGNGRVYTITFKVTDASGNVSTATAKVTVPKSQNGSAAVDDGPHYTVLSGCP